MLRKSFHQKIHTRRCGDDAQSIIIIPGHGLALAQAQHILHTLEKALIKKGTRVRYAIHPCAGRKPGHMNILRTEAKVPHVLLFDLDAINDDFQNTDVALIVGANDIINSEACAVNNSPLVRHVRPQCRQSQDCNRV